MSETQLEIPGTIKIVPNGALIERASLEEIGIALQILPRISSGARWALIDVLLYADTVYGDTYTQYVDETQMSYGTLANLRWLGRYFPAPCSRKWDLSQSHYMATCASYIEEKVRDEILTEAESAGLGRDWVRQQVIAYSEKGEIQARYSPIKFYHKVALLFAWARNNGLPYEIEEDLEHFLEMFKRRI